MALWVRMGWDAEEGTQSTVAIGWAQEHPGAVDTRWQTGPEMVEHKPDCTRTDGIGRVGSERIRVGWEGHTASSCWAPACGLLSLAPSSHVLTLPGRTLLPFPWFFPPLFLTLIFPPPHLPPPKKKIPLQKTYLHFKIPLRNTGYSAGLLLNKQAMCSGWNSN